MEYAVRVRRGSDELCQRTSFCSKIRNLIELWLIWIINWGVLVTISLFAFHLSTLANAMDKSGVSYLGHYRIAQDIDMDDFDNSAVDSPERSGNSNGAEAKHETQFDNTQNSGEN